MRVFIARHGRTNENEAGNISGNSNKAQLIDEGREHAKKLSEVLKKENFDAIFCSPLDRALETAKPIAKKLGLKLNIDDRLREFDFGTVDGKSETGEAKSHLDKRRKDIHYKFPEGESYEDVIKRISQFFELLSKKDYKKVLIVSHAGTNRAIVLQASQNKKFLNQVDMIRVPNSLVYVVDTLSKEVEWIDTLTEENGKGLKLREEL